jgi:integrase
MRIPARISLKLKLPPPTQLPWELDQRTPHGKVYLVGQIVDEYLRSEHYRSLSRNTQRIYRTALLKFEGIKLSGHQNLFHLKAYKVDYPVVDYVGKVLKYSLNKGSIQVYFTVMSAVWNYAVRGGRVHFNPWLRPGLQRSQERDTTWSKDQVMRAVEVAKDRGYNVLALYLLICYETAQRPWQDLRNLKWSNLKQIEAGKWALDFDVSKTNTHLIIPLSDAAKDAVFNAPKVSEYIFVNEKGRRYTEFPLKQQLDLIREEAAIPKNLQFRDLRRTAVTEMAISGCSTLEIEALTGWRCPDAVLRRYARVRLETAKNALKKRQELQGNS